MVSLSRSGAIWVCADEEASAFMTKRERINCTGSLGRWRWLPQRPYMHWILLLVLLGSLLCWNAGFYQGCWKESACGGLPSQQVAESLLREGFHKRLKSSVQNSQEIGFHRVSEKKAIYKDLSNLEVKIDHPAVVEAAIAFNDSVLLLLDSPISALRDAFYGKSLQLRCLFAGGVQTNVINAEDWTVHCSHPESALQKLVLGSAVTLEHGSSILQSSAVYGKIWWNKLVYGITPVENEGELLLFVKGLSHTKRSLSPKGLKCQYGENLKTDVVTFCQENVRCKLPPHRSQQELYGEQVTLVLGNNEVFPTVVRFLPDAAHAAMNAIVIEEKQKPFFLCVCTLVWNGAKFLREWIMYHSYLGVQRFFVYDNNSDDDTGDVLESLRSHNVSRHPWPWLKTQEASFSDCAVKASSQCMWVTFIDLDEFIFPKSFLPSKRENAIGLPLHSLVNEYDRVTDGKLGQLKISNFNFGPSGLKTLPKSGQMLNYVCRRSLPRRVKSVVRASAIHPSYCSRVHYFDLKPGYRSVLAARNDAIIHHYKYQVWEDFKMKFVRRAATFVTDWEQSKGLDSFDRTPGLGTEAVEPPNWAYQFCEVEDTSLRDFVSNTSYLYHAGKPVWEQG